MLIYLTDSLYLTFCRWDYYQSNIEPITFMKTKTGLAQNVELAIFIWDDFSYKCWLNPMK